MTAIGLGHPGSMRDEEGSESDRGKPSFRTSTPAPSSRRRWRARALGKTHRGTPSRVATIEAYKREGWL